MYGFKLIVNHRVDGLEMKNIKARSIKRVNHRVDGLEKRRGVYFSTAEVNHRIDDLEIKKVAIMTTFFIILFYQLVENLVVLHLYKFGEDVQF